MISGATLALGFGARSVESASYERVWSLGIQGIAHRTWPWWSPWLATLSTFAGGQAFAAFFLVRCSAGAMWPTRAGPGPSWIVIGGCGVGLP